MQTQDLSSSWNYTHEPLNLKLKLVEGASPLYCTDAPSTYDWSTLATANDRYGQTAQQASTDCSNSSLAINYLRFICDYRQK